MGHGELRPNYDYHIEGSIHKTNPNERDIRVDVVLCLSSENQIRTIRREASYMLMIVKTAFKHMGKDMLGKQYLLLMFSPNENVEH